ncbi:hypothetical protein [Brevifollis gellanilyticus]|nr:hypothetical protein [Brevifollis gellanilyticus]
MDAKRKPVIPELGLTSVLDIDVSYEIAEAEPGHVPKPKPPETGVKKFGSKSQTKTMFRDAEKRLVYELTRSMIWFPLEKKGLRMLDEISRKGLSGDLQFTIRYKTKFDPKSGIKARQLSTPAGDKGALALALVPGDQSKLSTVFLMGGLDDGWSRKIDAGEDYVEWSYTGRLQENEEIYLLHSVAFCKDADPKDLQDTFDMLIVNGMPFDPSLSDRVRNNLVNFPVTIKAQDAPEPPEEPVAEAKLVWLDRVLELLKLNRSDDKDLLQLEGGESVQGSFHGTTMKLGDQEFKQEDIAAILGEQGTRESRVFLRDGRVWRGRLEWQGARFESESLGTIVLKADAPGRIILRRGKSDGVITPKPLAWMAESRDGQVIPVTELPKGLLNLRWLGGAKSLPWPEVVSIRALPPPALESEIAMANGTRWRGWIESAASSGMIGSYWARDMPALVRLFGDAPVQPGVPNQPSVVLQDGSIFVGESATEKLSWRRFADDIEVKMADVASVKRLPSRDDEAAPAFELRMKNGTKLVGSPLEGSLAWRQGPEVLRIVWSWIQSIQITPQEAAKKS